MFYPETLAQASEDFRILSRAVLHEQASRKDTFEAALRRANRRANDAELKLGDMSQSYADKLKSKEEAHANTVESLRMENAALSASLTALRESFQTLSESSSRRAALDDKHAQLARLDELLPPLTTEAAKLLDVRTQASSHSAAIVAQHETLSNLIRQFLENFEEVSMKRLKGYGIDIQDESRAMGDRIREARVSWAQLSDSTETFWNGFKGLVEREESHKEEKGRGNGEETIMKESEIQGRKQKNEGREVNEEGETRREEDPSEARQTGRENGKKDEVIQTEEPQIQAEKNEGARGSEEDSKENAPREADEPQLMEVDLETSNPRTEEKAEKTLI